MRECEACGLTLVRKQRGYGLESMRDFTRRKFCSHSCSSTVTRHNLPPQPAMQAPAPVAFSVMYRAALAQGVDLLELNDAAWCD